MGVDECGEGGGHGGRCGCMGCVSGSESSGGAVVIFVGSAHTPVFFLYLDR